MRDECGRLPHFTEADLEEYSIDGPVDALFCGVNFSVMKAPPTTWNSLGEEVERDVPLWRVTARRPSGITQGILVERPEWILPAIAKFYAEWRESYG